MKKFKQYINEAKTMSQEVAIEILKLVKDRPAKEEIYLSIDDRDNIKAAAGVSKLTRDVPNRSKPTLLGSIIKAALGGKDDYYMDGGDFVKGDKTIKSAGTYKKIDDLIKAAKVKL